MSRSNEYTSPTMIEKANRLLVLAAAGLLITAWTGCSRDVRLAGKHLRDVKVRTVTHYGMTLDESATPKQVAYVLLRAVRDDFNADDTKARETALDVQFDVCAANEIHARNKTPLTRREALYKIVHLWTPTLAHYVSELPSSWDDANNRLVRLGPSEPEHEGDAPPARCQVLLEVADPAGDPNGGALIVISMLRDSGYWRVFGVGFAPGRRSLRLRPGAGLKQDRAPAEQEDEEPIP